MIVLISLVTGMTDIAAIVAISLVNLSMILFWLDHGDGQPAGPDRVVDAVLVRLYRRSRTLGLPLPPASSLTSTRTVPRVHPGSSTGKSVLAWQIFANTLID